MKVEGVGRPFTYRWPGGEVRLEPGRLIDLPDDRGKKLLAKAGDRVRVAQPSDWLTRWRDLAAITSGIESGDPREGPVLLALAQCHHSHEAGDLEGFTKGAARVQRLMQFAPGATVSWEGSMNHRLCLVGPAVIEHVHVSDGRLHVFVTWQGTGRWVNETIVQRIESR